MRVLLSIVCTVLLAAQGFCQLNNGSFEANTGFPAMLGDWSLVNGWNNAGSSSAAPDYFHLNANAIADLPETPCAIVQPYDGEAIMGLTICTKQGENKREYIQTKFDASLTVGEQYYLSFHITNGEITASSLAGLSVSDLGILLSTSTVVQTGDSPINATPQFVIDTVFYSAKWEMIIYSFIADQPYQYLTFGLFNDDAQHSIERTNGTSPQFAYYFVDDFALSTEMPVDTNPLPPVSSVSPNAPFFVPNAFTPNGDGDNDVFVPVAGFIKEWHLEIFTKWGNPVSYSKQKQKSWDGTCMGNPCANGSYIWKITYQVPDEKGEIRTATEYGFVNLVK